MTPQAFEVRVLAILKFQINANVELSKSFRLKLFAHLNIQDTHFINV